MSPKAWQRGTWPFARHELANRRGSPTLRAGLARSCPPGRAQTSLGGSADGCIAHDGLGRSRRWQPHPAPLRYHLDPRRRADDHRLDGRERARASACRQRAGARPAQRHGRRQPCCSRPRNGDRRIHRRAVQLSERRAHHEPQCAGRHRFHHRSHQLVHRPVQEPDLLRRARAALVRRRQDRRHDRFHSLESVWRRSKRKPDSPARSTASRCRRARASPTS